MPTAHQILEGLREASNTWKALSVAWHVYFGILAVVLLLGFHPTKRTAGLLLCLPLFSVSAVAWVQSNPFNGILFALIGVACTWIVAALPEDAVHIGRSWVLASGAILFSFGWVYPHFLDAAAPLTYLYAAPTGIIPCPTLSIVIGGVLLLDGLGSKNLCILLGTVGLFYGITGVLQLRVAIDWFLLLGAIAVLVRAGIGM